MDAFAAPYPEVRYGCAQFLSEHLADYCKSSDRDLESTLMFDLRMDPFEQRDGHRSNLVAMRKTWIGGIVREMLEEHGKSLQEFPPRQVGGTLTPGPQ